MSEPIISAVRISPSYELGFVFSWDVSPSCSIPWPWEFEVQCGESFDGPWTAVSPRISGTVFKLVNPIRASKNNVLYFRVVMFSDGVEHPSSPVMPYGDLGRREFLLCRDIMRREVLHARTLGGTKGAAFVVSTFGVKCTACTDPITGHVRDSACPLCLGTGRIPPYHGPYETWWSVSPTKTIEQFNQDGASGTIDTKDFSIRMIGAVQLKKNDVVLDSSTDKRYYVDVVEVLSEIRRIPVVQMLTVHEAALSDPIYSLDLK